jgi:hypothetical protein
VEVTAANSSGVEGLGFRVEVTAANS